MADVKAPSKSKSVTKSPTVKSTKSTNEPKPINNKPSHVPVIIYSILAVVLVGYGIYMYFAMRNGIWPFEVYILDTTKFPKDVVQPNGNVSYDNTTGKVYVDGKEDDDAVISEDERKNIGDQADVMQQTNCNYYCSKQGGINTFPIPPDQKVLGDCPCQ